MIKKKTDKDNKTDEEKLITPKKVVTAIKGETIHFIIGLLCVIFGVYLILAFTSFFFTGGNDQSILMHPDPNELMKTGNHIQNYAGARGAQLSQFLMNDCFGISAYLISLFLIIAGMKLMKAYQFKLWKWFIGCSIVMIWLSIALGFIFGGTFADSFIYPGGLHGYNVGLWISSQIGTFGLILFLFISLVFICIFFTRETIQIVRKALHPSIPKFGKGKAEDGEQAEETEDTTDEAVADTPSEEPVKAMEDEDSEEDSSEKEKEEDYDFSSLQPKEIPATVYNDPAPVELELDTRQEQQYPIKTDKPQDYRAENVYNPSPIRQPLQQNEIDVLEPEDADNQKDNEPAFEVTAEHHEDDEMVKGDLSQPYNPRLDLEHYRFPTMDLLNSYGDHEPTIDMEEQNANKDRIIQVLRSFGIEISSIKASVGPTITLYEITPAEGVRISKIRNLEDDIALSLSALGIRIIAPIPGKGTIGIEVPNANPRIVPMSSVLASKKFQETTFDLPIALGKTITNEVFMVDLAKAPHMLVAGATGQGKSVGLNAIVTSLLYKKHPSELKFVIIDPKKVEFAIYAPIEKHFLAKLPGDGDAIITDVTKVVQTLNSLCVEMDTRYDLLRKAGCRNIKEYNAKFINRQLNPNNGHRYMPYIVIIIDEFGDLIMTAGKEVELPICRIAQLARAVGIHAIIATQRPTTNIITGTIKANFPARVAFRVASMMDSRTILDRPGAQQLIGKGDLLYLQGNDPVRVQCAFVDTPEVERIANYISKQQGYPSAFELPEYVDENADSGSASGDVDMNKLDPLFEEAAQLLIYHQQGSTSLIQRKFSIGYNRAGRIMDQLERAGIVGPANGSKAREVLCMDQNDLAMRMSALKDN